MQLLCVAPEQVKEFWPHVENYIKDACENGLHDFDGSRRSVMDGSAFLWIVWTGQEIKAALTTELHKINGRRLCFISALGGRDRHEWLGLIDGIEKHARAEKCAAVIVMGRPGWQRELSGYRLLGTILERAL